MSIFTQSKQQDILVRLLILEILILQVQNVLEKVNTSLSILAGEESGETGDVGKPGGEQLEGGQSSNLLPASSS